MLRGAATRCAAPCAATRCTLRCHVSFRAAIRDASSTSRRRMHVAAPPSAVRRLCDHASSADTEAVDRRSSQRLALGVCSRVVRAFTAFSSFVRLATSVVTRSSNGREWSHLRMSGRLVLRERARLRTRVRQPVIHCIEMINDDCRRYKVETRLLGGSYHGNDRPSQGRCQTCDETRRPRENQEVSPG